MMKDLIARNKGIAQELAKGVSVQLLSQKYDLSRERIYQIGRKYGAKK